MVEIPYVPDSTLHCTFSCRCHVSVCTVSLGFAFSKQMHNPATNEKPRSVRFTFKPSVDMAMMGLSTETNLAWFLGDTHKSCLITCDYLRKEFWGCFKPLLKTLARVDVILLLLLTEKVGHEFCSKLTPAPILFQKI